LFHLRRIDQRAHRHASDPSVDRPRDGRGHRGKPAGGDRDLRRHRHARVGLPDRPLRQPVAALLLLRPARPFAAAPSLCIRQPPVRSHPVHRFLRPGLGCHCAADSPARAPRVRAAELRNRLRLDLCGPPARRGFDRVCGGRGADVLRRLPARFHVLGLAVPGRSRARAADRARQAAVGPGHRTWRWCGGSGLLLRLARRLAVFSIAIAIALVPPVASAHAQLVQSDPAPDSVVDSAPTSITLVFTEPVTPVGAGIRVFDPSGSQVAGAVLARGSVLTAPIVSSGTGTYVVILLIAAEPLALLGQLASLSFDGDTALAVLASSFGRIAGLRLGGAVLVWSLLGTSRSWPVLAIGGVVAVLDGAAAHAIPGLPGVGQLLVGIHVAAMGLWVGGLAAFLGAPHRVFGRYAAITLAIAVASGFVLGL